MDKYNSKLPRLFRQDAITIGQTTYYVFPDATHVDQGLKAHEDWHKRQYEELGLLTFLSRYLWYQLRYGYKDNPLEIEARKAAEMVVKRELYKEV